MIKSVQAEDSAVQFNPVVIRTQPGLEIESVSYFLQLLMSFYDLLNLPSVDDKVRIMGQDNYAVARTDRTLMVADLKYLTFCLLRA